MSTMRRLVRSANSESGQTIVLVAVVFVVLLGLGAMAVDVGGVLWSRGAEQNAADAAALAGVKELPANTLAAQTVAAQYAASNGFGSNPPALAQAAVTSQVSTTFNTNDTLTVTVQRDIQGGLRQAVGGGNISVPAQAVAIVAPSVPVCGYVPFAIEDHVWLYSYYKAGIDTTTPYDETYGQMVVLKTPTRDHASFLEIPLVTSAQGGGNQQYTAGIEQGGCLPETMTGHNPDYGATTRNAVYNAIQTCDPSWNPNSGNPPLDNVFWQVSSTALQQEFASDPYASSPGPVYTLENGQPLVDSFTGQSITYNGQAIVDANGNPFGPNDLPFGLGCPDGGATCACSGPPTPDNPFPMPKVFWNSTTLANPCPRVVLVVIMPQNSVADSCWGNAQGCPIVVEKVAAFYLIGMEKIASKWYPVGAFLQTVEADGPPSPGGALDGPVGYYLWK